MNTAQRLISSFYSGARMRLPVRAKTFLKPFDPHINRHTGRVHEHKREIARRLRQQARRAA